MLPECVVAGKRLLQDNTEVCKHHCIQRCEPSGWLVGWLVGRDWISREGGRIRCKGNTEGMGEESLDRVGSSRRTGGKATECDT